MTVVNPKSISGINSITTGSGSDNLLTIHTSDASSTERVRINSSGDVIVGLGIVTTLTATTGIVTTLTANTTTHLDDVSFTGASYNMTWDKSDNSLIVNDDARIKFGTGKDLHIYHNQSNSVIREEGTGNLNLQTTGGNVEVLVNTTETAAKFISDGAVELYHNNSKKFDTDSEGISVTGTVKINNTSSVGDYNGGADDMLIGTHSGNHGMTILSGTSNGGYIMFSDNNGGGTNAYRGQIEYAHSSDYMRFMTNSAEALRIDSNKMLGLGGVTPKTQNTFNTIEFGLAGFLGSQTGARTIEMASNAYYNSGWKYRAADVASQYYQYQGYHAFTSASSGSADGAISFSEKLRILADGGITFNGDTATANALDDYEEGTFTPDWRGASALGTTTYGSYNAASYIKVGNQVTVRGYSELNGSSGGSGMWFMNNLPFNVKNGHGYRSVGSVLIENFNLDSDIIDVVCYANPNTNDMHLRGNRDNANYSANIRANTDDNFEVAWTLTYEVA